MTATGELFLGIIAVAVLIMALIQVAAIFAGIRLAKRVDQLATQIDQDIRPLIANLTALSSEAARAASLAAKQAERFDRMFADMMQRVDVDVGGGAGVRYRTRPAGDGDHGRRQAVIDAFQRLPRSHPPPRRGAAGSGRGRIAFHRLIHLPSGYGGIVTFAVGYGEQVC